MHEKALRPLFSIALAALLSNLGPSHASAQETSEPVATTASVAESAICTAVEDRVPVGAATEFHADVDRLFCWTRIQDAAGQTITHAWIHEGVTRARVELKVGADHWRTYSSKLILPSWTGEWELKVFTEEGAVLATIPFTVN